MTNAQLKQKLKAVLRRYNCVDWDVTITTGHVDVVEDGDVELPGGGECATMYRYHRASIIVGTEVEEKNIDYIVQHEAAHVLLGEMSDTVKRILAFIPEEQQKAVWDIYMDAEEHTCDRLAKSIMHKDKQ